MSSIQENISEISQEPPLRIQDAHAPGVTTIDDVRVIHASTDVPSEHSVDSTLKIVETNDRLMQKTIDVLTMTERDLFDKIKLACGLPHAKKKSVIDTILPPNSQARIIARIKQDADGIRTKLNGSLPPDCAKVISGLKERVDREIEMRRHYSS